MEASENYCPGFVRILHVVTDTDRRGSQVFGTDLADALIRRGHTCRAVALAPGTSGRGLDVPVLGPTRLGPATLRALRGQLSGWDVVIAHGSSTLPACVLAGAGRRFRLVYRQISDTLFWAGTVRKRLRVRFLLGRCQGVFALADSSAQVLIDHFGVAPAKLRIVPNGVPTGRFTGVVHDRRAARAEIGVDTEAPLALYVGALVPEKGVDLLIEAATMLPGWKIVVVGDGPERHRLRDLAARRAPAGAVDFLGAMASPVAAYEAADVVVLPSRGGDSMPGVLIEAGMLGVPAVATPIGATADVVLDGRTGRIVPVGDAAELARGVTEVFAQAARFGEEARRHCLEHFDLEVVADAWEQALLQLVDGTSMAGWARRRGT